VPRRDPNTEYAMPAKQWRFCHEYVVDCNANAAARRAGYSEGTCANAAQHLLGQPRIKAYIDNLIGRTIKEADLNAQRVLKELMRMAYANMRNYTKPDEASGYVRIDLNDISEDQWAAIQEFTVDETGGSGDGERMAVQRVRFKLADKTKALELLARHLRLLTDRTEIVADDVLVAQLLEGRARRDAGK
jgi:phage terminase small subunit